MPVTIKSSFNRAFSKALSWRLVATFTTVVIAYFATGRIDVALEIGFFEFFLKIGVYMLHEKVWNIIPYGLYVEENGDSGKEDSEKSSSAAAASLALAPVIALE